MSKENINIINKEQDNITDQDLGIKVISLSEVNNYQDENNNIYSSYESSELTDYSNLSLTNSNTNTNISSGSNICMHQKVNPLDDPIIQEMFKQ